MDQKPVISVTDTVCRSSDFSESLYADFNGEVFLMFFIHLNSQILKRSQAEENGKSAAQEKKIKGLGEEGEPTKERNDDLEKSERDGGDGVGNGNKSQSLTLKHQQLTPLAEKSGRFFLSSSCSLFNILGTIFWEFMIWDF